MNATWSALDLWKARLAAAWRKSLSDSLARDKQMKCGYQCDTLSDRPHRLCNTKFLDKFYYKSPCDDRMKTATSDRFKSKCDQCGDN
jgi:hypothetical protein